MRGTSPANAGALQAAAAIGDSGSADGGSRERSPSSMLRRAGVAAEAIVEKTEEKTVETIVETTAETTVEQVPEMVREASGREDETTQVTTADAVCSREEAMRSAMPESANEGGGARRQKQEREKRRRMSRSK